MDVFNREIITTVLIAGLTATGKSELAIEIAAKLNGEIVSADSMQIYKGLDIGTAKITNESRRGVVHHMIDVVAPETCYSVADYVRDAQECIRKISERGKLPVICGGTGLYISSLLGYVKLDCSGTLQEKKEIIEEEYDKDKGRSLLNELRASNNPYRYKHVHVNDKKRIVRSIEKERYGYRPPKTEYETEEIISPYRCIEIIILPKDREMLYKRIDSRTDNMLEMGLLKEAGYVYRNRMNFKTAAQAIAYKEFFPYFEGVSTLEKCVEKLKQSTRQYAKRQATWFKRYNNAVFIDSETLDFNNILSIVKNRIKV